MRELTEEDLDVATLVDIDEFIGMCITGELEDSDGYGYIVFYESDIEDKKEISPSDVIMMSLSDDDITHVLWFNQHY